MKAKGVDGLILLETNTQPGMTPRRLPEQAQAVGIAFPKLCAGWWRTRHAIVDAPKTAPQG